MTKKSIESVGQLLEELTLLQGRKDKSMYISWYRGQANARWPLVPEVMRDWFLASRPRGEPAHEFEWWLTENFQREGAHLLPGGASTTIVYFLARHHGLPTRLLDWSTNALVALFFATATLAKEPGAIFVMFPRRLRDGGPVNVRHSAVRTNIARLFVERRPSRASQRAPVVPILPDATVGRMLQQGACFTLHPPKRKSLGAMIPTRAYVKYQIPAAAKSHIQRELRRAGISWATLFPDLENLAREIRARQDLIPSDGSWVSIVKDGGPW